LFWPKTLDRSAAQPAPVPSAVATTSALSQRLRHESSMRRISRSCWVGARVTVRARGAPGGAGARVTVTS